MKKQSNKEKREIDEILKFEKDSGNPLWDNSKIIYYKTRETNPPLLTSPEDIIYNGKKIKQNNNIIIE